jgi:hypothetical protein
MVSGSSNKSSMVIDEHSRFQEASSLVSSTGSVWSDGVSDFGFVLASGHAGDGYVSSSDHGPLTLVVPAAAGDGQFLRWWILRRRFSFLQFLSLPRRWFLGLHRWWVTSVRRSLTFLMSVRPLGLLKTSLLELSQWQSRLLSLLGKIRRLGFLGG